MNRRLRTLVICAAAILVLGGAVAAVAVFGGGLSGPGEEPEPTAPPEDIVLLSKDKDAAGEPVASPVNEMTVTVSSGEYRLSPREDGSMGVDRYPDLPMDTMAIRSMCTNLASLKAISEVTDPQPLSAYGLDPPVATVKAVFHDGSGATVYFGNQTPYETGYYLALEGNDGVYIADSGVAEQFILSSELSLLGKTLIAAPTVNEDDSEGRAQLLSLRLTGGGRKQPVAVETDTEGRYADLTYVSSFVMTAPFRRAVDSQQMSELSDAMLTLTASEAVRAHPSAAELDGYGLSDPVSAASFTLSVISPADDDSETLTHYNDREHMILLGNIDEEGNYYALVDGIDIVYLLSPESVPWAEATAFDLASKLLFLKDITDISTVTVVENGQETDFSLKHFPDKTDKDEQLTVSSGSQIWPTSSFRKLYQLLIGIHRVGDPEPDAQPQGTPVLELNVTFTSGDPMTVSLYPMTASRLLCVTDDGEQTAVSLADTETFFRQYHRFLAGEEVITPN